MSEGKFQWYALRAISGKEAKVKEVLDAAIKNTDLGLYVEQVLIPTQKVFTSRNGKKVIKEKNLFPGYVFVQAQLTGEVQYELRNTTHVIDFVRGRAKNKNNVLNAPDTTDTTDKKELLYKIDKMEREIRKLKEQLYK